MGMVVSWVLIGSVLSAAASLLVYQAITGVPSMPASAAEIADVIALLREGEVKEQAVIYELGCGWGSLVVALARAFPLARIRGIEISPLPYWVARLRTRRLANVSLTRGDFLRADLRDAGGVTCYLMIKPMLGVASLLDRMLEPRTPVVSLAFWFRGRTVAATRNGPGLRGAAALYLWPGEPAEVLHP